MVDFPDPVMQIKHHREKLRLELGKSKGDIGDSSDNSAAGTQFNT